MTAPSPAKRSATCSQECSGSASENSPSSSASGCNSGTRRNLSRCISSPSNKQTQKELRRMKHAHTFTPNSQREREKERYSSAETTGERFAVEEKAADASVVRIAIGAQRLEQAAEQLRIGTVLLFLVVTPRRLPGRIARSGLDLRHCRAFFRRRSHQARSIHRRATTTTTPTTWKFAKPPVQAQAVALMRRRFTDIECKFCYIT